MPAMYVGNASKQIIQFAYRVPERKGVVVQPIPIGGQVLLAPNGTNTDLSSLDIDSIVKQYSKYGMVEVSELDSTKEPFTGCCYSVGKPISVDKLRRAMERDEDRLEKLGQKIRQEAAVAVNSQIESNLGAPLRGLEMSASEIEPNGGFKDDGTKKHVAEGVRVTRRQEGRNPRRGSLPSIELPERRF